MQDNRVTDTDIQSLDEVGVVERCTLHTGSGKLDRVKDRDRSDAAGTTRLQLDVAQDSSFFLCGILVCNSPFRGFGALAHLLANAQFIDFDDCAVNRVIDIIAFFSMS